MTVVCGRLLAGVMTVGVVQAAGQNPATVDTVLTARGVVQLLNDRPDTVAVWVVMLPEPITVGPLRTNALELAGGGRDGRRYVDRFVEVQGRVTIGRDEGGQRHAVIAATRVREVRPEGTDERAVDLSMSQHASVILSIVPRRVVWHDSAGAATGVIPTVLFSIVNHSQTPLEFAFPTNEVVCVSVRPEYGGGGGETIWRVTGPQNRIVLRMGAIFRQILAVPDSTARWPGRYTVRASLCGADDFHAETQFEVATP